MAENKVGCFKIIFGTIGIILFFSFIFRVCSGGSTRSDDTDTMALVMSRDFVRDKLLSPSTAEFAGMSDSKVVKKGEAWTVVSYVDAKNAFGVPLRKHYACRLRYNKGDNTWSLLDLNIE